MLPSQSSTATIPSAQTKHVSSVENIITQSGFVSDANDRHLPVA